MTDKAITFSDSGLHLAVRGALLDAGVVSEEVLRAEVQGLEPEVTPTMNDRVREIAEAWAARHGVTFEWKSDKQITYTNAVGAWFLVTTPLNGDDDWISIHPTETGCEFELVSSWGHVEVSRLTPDELIDELEGSLKWFEGWKRFMSFGPGPGH